MPKPLALQISGATLGPFLSVPLISPKGLALPLKSSAPEKKSLKVRLIYEITDKKLRRN
jgi:hypothetical protein